MPFESTQMSLIHHVLFALKYVLFTFKNGFQGHLERAGGDMPFQPRIPYGYLVIFIFSDSE
jgi:hypothetical protein